MVQNIVKLGICILVTSVFAEQQLRSQPKPQASLVADTVRDAPNGESKRKSLVRLVAATGDEKIKKPKRSEKDEIIEVTDFKEMGLMNTGEVFVSFVCWLVLYAILAVYYHKYVLFYAPEDENTVERQQSINYHDFQDWRSGLFGCGEHLDITFWSCCCPGIRWSDTISKVGIARFYHAFFIMTCLWGLMFIPITSVLCFLVIVSYMTYQRQAIREKFDFDEQGGSTLVTDCLTYLCCMCCAVAQEARHTREACIAGHKAIVAAADRTPRD